MAGFPKNNKAKENLINEIQNALSSVDFGSVDIIVQDGKVTQISVRNIKKTSLDISAQENDYFTVQAPIKRHKSQ